MNLNFNPSLFNHHFFDVLSNTQLWILIAVLLVCFELFTLTLYLLVVATGFLISALCAYMGLPLYLQMTALCLTILMGLFGLAQLKKKSSLNSNSINYNDLDIGARVWVDAWQQSLNQTHVNYKGALWQAKLAPSHLENNQMPPAGWYYIKKIERNTLILEMVHPI